MGNFRNIVAGGIGLAAAALAAGSANAAPVGPGALAAGPAAAPVENVQFYYGPGYGYYGGPRPFYGPRPYYGYGGGPGYGYGPGPGYGRRVVCRFRPTPYGPRRVCFRR